MRQYLVLCSLLVVSSCTRVAPNVDADSQQETAGQPTHNTGSQDDGFYNLLNLSQANYVPLSAAEMAHTSAVIATGTFVAVSEGMSVNYKDAKVPTRLTTLVVALDVEEGIKGTQLGERLHIEFIHGGAVPVATYASRLTAEPVTVFLTPAIWLESDAVDYVNVGSGHPEGTKLYSLSTPQGLLIAREGHLLQPTAHEQALQLFQPEMDSLDDIAVWYDSGAQDVAAPDIGNDSADAG